MMPSPSGRCSALPSLRGSLWVLLATFLLLGNWAHAATVSYKYDDAGRLVEADYTDGSQTIVVQYAYDAAGNLVSVTQQ